jgi:tetratricopeptide (TPR) repeat protein
LKRLLLALASSILALAVCGSAGWAGGPRSDPPASSDTTPEQLAAEAYEDGLSSLDTARRLEKKVDDPRLSADRRATLEAEAEGAYRQAIERFTRAVENDPGMYLAWGNLGHACRRIGDHATALRACRQALTLKPDYGEALEDLGEAYLGLDRIADAQEAYGRLQEIDRKLAKRLLSAARAWIALRQVEPAGVKVDELEEFERWVDERQAG